MKVLTVKKLKQIISDLPDDMQIMLLQEGGNTCMCSDAFVDSFYDSKSDSENDNKVLWLNH